MGRFVGADVRDDVHLSAMSDPTRVAGVDPAAAAARPARGCPRPRTSFLPHLPRRRPLRAPSQSSGCRRAGARRLHRCCSRRRAPACRGRCRSPADCRDCSRACPRRLAAAAATPITATQNAAAPTRRTRDCIRCTILIICLPPLWTGLARNPLHALLAPGHFGRFRTIPPGTKLLNLRSTPQRLGEVRVLPTARPESSANVPANQERESAEREDEREEQQPDSDQEEGAEAVASRVGELVGEPVGAGRELGDERGE